MSEDLQEQQAHALITHLDQLVKELQVQSFDILQVSSQSKVPREAKFVPAILEVLKGLEVCCGIEEDLDFAGRLLRLAVLSQYLPEHYQLNSLSQTGFGASGGVPARINLHMSMRLGPRHHLHYHFDGAGGRVQLRRTDFTWSRKD